MFLSKIWFFLVAVAGATALTIALLLPRPSERQRAADEQQRITTACDVVNILLRTNARSRIDLAGKFARAEQDLASILGPEGKNQTISEDGAKNGRKAAAELLESTTGTKPSFIILVDIQGRVVARVGMQSDALAERDTLAGYYLVDDALDGYLRDDLWIIDKELYLVAASPVIGTKYAGAIIIGHRMDKALAEQLVKPLGVDVNFYADGQLMIGTSTASVHKDVGARYARVSAAESPLAEDCHTFEPFRVQLGDEAYAAQIGRLPGEAGERGGFFAVYTKSAPSLGVMGTLDTAKQEDLSFANFPWITLGIGFVLTVAVGMLLMILESDRPLRRLASVAVKVAKDEQDRFDEEAHRGKFGSIARSVNIRLDKMEREAKAKKTDLDDLLGPPSASALPLAGPGTPARPAKPPPPSEFKFTSGPARAETSPPPPPLPLTPTRAHTPPPVPPVPVTPIAAAGSAPAVPPPLADPPDSEEDEVVFRRVFQEFLQTKKECGESTSNLTYEQFASKLRKNRESLRAKHGCEEVRFQVYVKDGKAALKATPVKDA